MDNNNEHRTYWVWWDNLLEEWFYTNVSLDETPELRDQLELEKTTIHQVKAESGLQAVEKVCPGYRQERNNKITQPVKKTASFH